MRNERKGRILGVALLAMALSLGAAIRRRRTAASTLQSRSGLP